MASAGNAHGGQEQTMTSLNTTMFHWGAIVVAPGYTNDARSMRLEVIHMERA